jgi:hypothetical protein
MLGIRPDTDFEVLHCPLCCAASGCRSQAGEVPRPLEDQAMNDYQVIYSNGVVVEIEAWTPEAAAVIAEEDAELQGWSGLSAVSVELLISQPVEQ